LSPGNSSWFRHTRTVDDAAAFASLERPRSACGQQGCAGGVGADAGRMVSTPTLESAGVETPAWFRVVEVRGASGDRALQPPDPTLVQYRLSMRRRL
jgi:hypothetical protein